MPRKKKETNRVDAILDELLEEHQTPEAILGESGLLKQLSKRLIERALAGELNHHLRNQGEEEQRNSRNGHSKKHVQSEHGDRQGKRILNRKGWRQETCHPIQLCGVLL